MVEAAIVRCGWSGANAAVSLMMTKTQMIAGGVRVAHADGNDCATEEMRLGR